jgi:hypothetical protein
MLVLPVLTALRMPLLRGCRDGGHSQFQAALFIGFGSCLCSDDTLEKIGQPGHGSMLFSLAVWVSAIAQCRENRTRRTRGRPDRATRPAGRRRLVDFGPAGSFCGIRRRGPYLDLDGVEFVDKHEVIHFIGQSRHGRSHLAVAVSVEVALALAP